MTGLTAARKRAGLSIAAAARLLGVPPLRLRRFESGQALPSRAQLIKLSRIYGAEFAELAGLSRQKPRQSAEGEWYLIEHGGQTAVYHTGQPPREGEWALVRGEGGLCEKIANEEILQSGEIIAVRVKIITKL